MPFLGGLRFLSAEWVSPLAIAVRFESTWDELLHQLYAGRTLIGATFDVDERLIVAQLQESHWPQHLTLVAVDPEERSTDYGEELPLRPYNRVRIRCTTSGWSDAKVIDVLAGDAAGEAVNPDNRVVRELFDEDREYTLTTPPLPGSGTWNFEVVGRDDKPPEGNVGDPLELSQEVLAHPPDLDTDFEGRRLTVSVEAGVATVSFTPDLAVP